MMLRWTWLGLQTKEDVKKTSRQCSGCELHDECVFVLNIFTHSVLHSFLFFLSSNFLHLIFFKGMAPFSPSVSHIQVIPRFVSL